MGSFLLQLEELLQPNSKSVISFALRPQLALDFVGNTENMLKFLARKDKLKAKFFGKFSSA